MKHRKQQPLDRLFWNINLAEDIYDDLAGTDSSMPVTLKLASVRQQSLPVWGACATILMPERC